MRLAARLLTPLLLTSTLFAQLSPKPADAVIPVVGSTRGQSNANFKTELQLANPGETTKAGWLVLRPQVIALRYELPAHTTLTFADVVADLGASGLGSLDILADSGGVPTIVARAYDDQPTGTTGVSVPAIPAGDVLARADLGALIVPRDLVRYRFNVGVRALDNGTSLELTIRTPSGAQRAIRDVSFTANQFVQQSGDAFAGTVLQPNESIEIRIAAGSAIIYATTVDNATNDSSMQVLRR
jgi:hypothetical protein